MTLDNKLEKLKELLNGYGQMLVALSGGVDSVFLLAFAYKVWGDDRVAALTASGPHFAADEVEYARQLCDNLGISHKTIDVGYILPLIEDNPEDRCYTCKKAIFSELREYANIVGSVLADGTNLDDMSDFRPGHKAILELGVASPLKDAGLTKAEIREALESLAADDAALRDALMLPMWEKPAFACLASRIPYGEKITAEKLQAIYEAERFLHGLGFSQVRVRHHGDVARIEVSPENRTAFFDTAFMDKVADGIKKYGFKFVALDLNGYKMGSLNNSNPK